MSEDTKEPKEPPPPRLRVTKGTPWRIDSGRRAKWSSREFLSANAVEVRQIGDPVLHASAKKPRLGRPELEALVARMFASMVVAHGIGIAAPQVGVPLRVAIMDVDEAGIVALEPTIEWTSEEKEETSEGCLSVRGLYGMLERPVAARLVANDLAGKRFTLVGDEFGAQCMLHETDHLNGTLYVDRLRSREDLAAVSGRALNVHASLLPRWRGAAPIAHAILAGDPETGVTLMEGTAELDAGPILAEARTKIGDETKGELEARLARLGGELLEREMPRYLAGKLVRKPQDTKKVTLAPKLEPREGELDFARPAEELVRRVRAYTPDPGAFIAFRGQRIGVLRSSVAGGRGTEHGTLEIRDGVPHVAAGAGWLRLEEVKPAGRRAMTGAEWSRGLRDIRAAERVPS